MTIVLVQFQSTEDDGCLKMVLLLDAPCLCVCVCLCVCFCVCLWLCPCAEQWRCWWRPSSGGTLTSGTSSTSGSSLLVSMFSIGDSVKPVLVITSSHFLLIYVPGCCFEVIGTGGYLKILITEIKEQSMVWSYGKYLVFLMQCFFSKQHSDYSNLCRALCSSPDKNYIAEKSKVLFQTNTLGHFAWFNNCDQCKWSVSDILIIMQMFTINSKGGMGSSIQGV